MRARRYGRSEAREIRIRCALCTSTAEGLFEMSDAGCAFVAKQPSNADETALCTEAMESCPVQAIGDDGE